MFPAAVADGRDSAQECPNIVDADVCIIGPIAKKLLHPIS